MLSTAKYSEILTSIITLFSFYLAFRELDENWDSIFSSLLPCG
jgi:hypothetical protein